MATGADCATGEEHETDATFDCKLKGQVDAWGVSETSAWFQWGRTELLEEKTPPIEVPISKSEGEEEPLFEVSASLTGGLRPNTTFYDELVGEDHNVKAPELLTSTIALFMTPSVPPRVVGEPIAAFSAPTS